MSRTRANTAVRSVTSESDGRPPAGRRGYNRALLTQILLAELTPALPPGFTARPADAHAAAILFPGAADACQIIAPDGMDAICEAARQRLRNGAPFVQTQLGDILEMLVRERCAFAMFPADELGDLPMPSTIEELMRDVEQQLKTHDAGAIYVRWHGRG